MSLWRKLCAGAVLALASVVLGACDGVSDPTRLPRATTTVSTVRMREVEGIAWGQGETDSPLVVLYTKLFFTGLGETAYVIGELSNPSTEPVTDVVVRYKGFGAGDELLDAREGTTASRYVLPGEAVAFKAEGNLRDVLRFEIVVDSRAIADVPENTIRVVSSTMGDVVSGSSWIEGDLENTGDTAVDQVRVVAVLRDDESSVVEVATVVLRDGLAPGERASFRYMAYRRGATSHEVLAELAE